MTKNWKLSFRQWTVLIHDFTMIIIAWMLAYYVRQNLAAIPLSTLKQSIELLPIVLMAQSVFFIVFGLYRGVWQFASVADLLRIIKAVFCGMITLLLYAYFAFGFMVVPRSIPILYAVFLVLLLSFGRLSVRLYKERQIYTKKTERKRILIVGSGVEAEKLLREILSSPKLKYQPVAIVDRNLSKHNLEIHGVRIIGGIDKIPEVVNRYAIDMIFIGITNASSEEMTRILNACQASNVPSRIIPSYSDHLEEKKLLQTMREISIDDLLGREAYHIDLAAFSQMITDKTVLVTGGGGSIGSELAHQIAQLNPKLLLIVDHSEANLYHVDLSLQHAFPALQTRPCLVDVTKRFALEKIFEAHKPEVVFHAAAYKHVPLLENQIAVAIQNNIYGSKNVVDLSIKYQTDVFVQVSTDKAVNPTNVMGLTKRAAEIYCQQLLSQKTKIITVRFGNVLGSVGSVVPLFKKQLACGGPLTVTHPDITRYFMTIPEACRLILQAMVIGHGGEIFVLDMGKPMPIKSLAERMISLAGKRPYDDIDIVFTGLRPGEKLYEELFYDQENAKKTEHQKIFLAENKHAEIDAHTVFEEIFENIHQGHEQTLLESLKKIVPEYKSNEATV